ncbi:hypothetical protein DSCW_54770 [Desulfosarcina widdelii]|uniref:Uncharacterized protein n=2 Tax=Desulfosarcina widdelii TaxID=947919 RepID=A0A5K7ZB93_9BACT|nr:hypothetical protein DSCW_54770 [Desulfosarcina widdelii]
MIVFMETAVRKKTGKTETRLSVAVMAILVVVAAGVFVRQYRINPAVIALRPESHLHTLSSESDRPPLIDTAGLKMSPFSPPERFGPETLYEKINGRADLYLSSGFVSLETQRFAMDATAGTWVEVFVYDMGTQQNAFSVFSMQRREDAHPDDIAPNAYRTENALFLAHKKFYIELIGTDASLDLQAAMGELASKFLQERGGAAAEAPGADLFPKDDMRPGSLQLIAANAFGYEQLNRIYTEEYNLNGSRLTAFVSRRDDADAASALAREYQRTLISFGAVRIDEAIPLEGAVALQFFDTYEIVFSRGDCFAGIHEADSLEAAMVLAGRLAAHLKK